MARCRPCAPTAPMTGRGRTGPADVNGEEPVRLVLGVARGVYGAGKLVVLGVVLLVGLSAALTVAAVTGAEP